MRRRSAFAIGIIVSTLILSAAVPAQAAPRLRLYTGETSQGEGIKFVVAKNDRGRFVRQMDLGVTFACEDGTTQVWGIGWGFGGFGPAITDGEFTYDDVGQSMAAHFVGRLGPLSGEGTVSIAVPSMTADEQAQLCTTGDVTWEVEFRRIIQRPRVDAPAGYVLRAA